MPKIIDRVGETNIANNKQKMTIIKYNKYNDIDIQFEDGYIVTKKKYSRFKKGNIANPNYNYKLRNRVGETSTATNGMKMTIIKYNKSNDIDIQFEDGYIVRNTSYQNFSIGLISHPDHSYRIKDRTGETNIATNGMKMTIIKYRNCDDIDIQFEDGAIVTKKIYSKFKEGNIAHPNYSNGKNVQCRIGETNIATNGMKMTIIRYRTCNDIDIQFEDGYIVEHKSYASFNKGIIGNPNCDLRTRIDRVGETSTATNGMKMTIIKYNKYNDIDIQFEDGYIVEHKSYDAFTKSSIGHKLPYQMDNIIIEELAYVDNNVGNFFCHCTKCGERDIMTISEAKDHACDKIENGD